MAVCFVITPFGAGFTALYEEAIRPVVESLEIKCSKGDDVGRAGVVFDQVRLEISAADLCVADLSEQNGNVLSEVGIALAYDKPLILITQDEPEKLPFNLRHLRVFPYKRDGLDILKDTLREAIKATLRFAGTSEGALLKELLAPSTLTIERTPFYIAASPLAFRGAYQTETVFAT